MAVGGGDSMVAISAISTVAKFSSSSSSSAISSGIMSVARAFSDLWLRSRAVIISGAQDWS